MNKFLLPLITLSLTSAANAEKFDVFTDVYRQHIEVGELPPKLVNDFNTAQKSLLEKRSTIQAESKAELQKPTPNKKRIYQINCVEVPDIMNAMIVNETMLLDQVKKDSDVYINFTKLIKETRKGLNERADSCEKMKSKLIEDSTPKPFTIHKANR